MYYINKIDDVSENNEISIPTASIPLTINLSALVFGYSIRKLIASYGSNNLEIIRSDLDEPNPDFVINGIQFKLPYSETEDALSDGTDGRVYYCAGNILMNTKYELTTPDPKFNSYHVDNIRSISDTTQYMFYFGTQLEAILGQIEYGIMNFREKSKPTSLVAIHQFGDYVFNVVSLDIPGRSNMPIGNNNGFIFKDTQVGFGDKLLTDTLGFIVTDYTTDAQAAAADGSKPIYKTVIAAAKIACASSASFGVLYILSDGYLYWTIDETTSVKIAKVYNKDLILHYGWYKTIECGQVLITYNNAKIREFGDKEYIETYIDELFEAFKQYSMVIDQDKKAVLIRELITRDFPRDSLMKLLVNFSNMTISPAGVFSGVSIKSGGVFNINCTLEKYGDNAYTNTEMLQCVNDGNSAIYKPLNADNMFKNSIFVADKFGMKIGIIGKSVSSALSMMKGVKIKCHGFNITFSCITKDEQYTEQVRIPLNANYFYDGADVDVDWTSDYMLSFNNYSTLDLSNFYSNSVFRSGNGYISDHLRYIYINPGSGQGSIPMYYPIIKMNSFAENAKINFNDVIINFDDTFINTNYRIGECSNMLVNLKDSSGKNVLETGYSRIKFQTASTDFNPRDIFGLVRPKKISWLIKSIDDKGNLIRIHSHC